jgi:hypothetical protein
MNKKRVPDLIAEITQEIESIARIHASIPLDLVELEKIDPIHQESIRSKGRIVYEQI